MWFVVSIACSVVSVTWSVSWLLAASCLKWFSSFLFNCLFLFVESISSFFSSSPSSSSASPVYFVLSLTPKHNDYEYLNKSTGAELLKNTWTPYVPPVNALLCFQRLREYDAHQAVGFTAAETEDLYPWGDRGTWVQPETCRQTKTWIHPETWSQRPEDTLRSEDTLRPENRLWSCKIWCLEVEQSVSISETCMAIKFKMSDFSRYQTMAWNF